MSIIALFVVCVSIIALFCAGLVSVVASGAPGYYIGFLTPREMRISRGDHRIGMLSMCDEEGSICTNAPITARMQAVSALTLPGLPAVIAPSYQEDVTVMAPITIGDHRDARGRFMPRYKA